MSRVDPDGDWQPRRVLNRRIRTVQFFFVALVGTVLAIGPTTEFLAGNVAGTRMAIAAVALVFAVFGVRVLRLGIVLCRDRLVVRNVFRSYVIPRNEIERVDPPPAYGKMWKAGLLVHRCNGRSVSASAFARTPIDRGADTETQLVSSWLSTGVIPIGGPPRHSAGQRSRRSVAWTVWLTFLGLLVAFAALTVIGAIVDASGAR